MSKIAILLIGSFVSISALAEKVEPPAAKVPGINEQVTVSYANGVWSDGTKTPKSAPNPVTTKIIPVSEAAFEALAALDKSATYKCVVTKSTADQVGHDPYWHPVTTTLYTLEINCQ